MHSCWTLERRENPSTYPPRLHTGTYTCCLCIMPSQHLSTHSQAASNCVHGVLWVAAVLGAFTVLMHCMHVFNETLAS